MDSFPILQEAFAAKNWPQVESLLGTCLVQASSQPNGQGQLQQIYEIGAYSAISSQNLSSLDRYVSLLLPIYLGRHASQFASESNAYVLLGAHLLSLLVRNHTSQFHVLLEQIGSASALSPSNPYLQFALQLQQCLVEGTYHRVVLARQQAPSPHYLWFIDSLMDTIRRELADCLEKSFRSIDLAGAAQLLLISADQIPHLTTFAQQRGWKIVGDNIVFIKENVDGKSLTTLTHTMIQQTMGYARELEQII